MNLNKQFGVSYVIFIILALCWLAFSLLNYTPGAQLSVAKLPAELTQTENPSTTEHPAPAIAPESAPATELSIAELIQQHAQTPGQIQAIEQAVSSMNALARVDLKDDEDLQAAVIDLLAGVACLKHEFIFDAGSRVPVPEQVHSALMRDKAFAAKVEKAFSAWRAREDVLGDEALLGPQGSGCKHL